MSWSNITLLYQKLIKINEIYTLNKTSEPEDNRMNFVNDDQEKKAALRIQV